MMFPAGNDVALRANDVCLAAQLPPQAAASFPAQPEHHCEAHHTARSTVHHSPEGGTLPCLIFFHKKDRTPPALPDRARCGGATPSTGQVQGVGFRYRARYAAQTLDLTGWVENEDDGSVTLEVQGDPEKFLSAVRHDPEKRLYPDHRHPPEGSCRPTRGSAASR